jgi:hypothetical protein
MATHAKAHNDKGSSFTDDIPTLSFGFVMATSPYSCGNENGQILKNINN